MLHLKLIREYFLNHTTIGSLFLNGEFFCYTLEDKVRQPDKSDPNYLNVAKWKVKGETAIPAGAYPVIVSRSNRFQRDLPEVLGVPGFSGIRIHPGNTSEDTEGCILVGTEVTKGKQFLDGVFLSNSRTAFNALFTEIKANYKVAEANIMLEVI